MTKVIMLMSQERMHKRRRRQWR